MSLKRTIRDLLIMTKAERNGVVVLLVLIIIVISIRLILPCFIRDDKSYIEEIEQKIAVLKNEKQKVISSSETKTGKVDTESHSMNVELIAVKTPVQYFQFDPNKVSLDEMIDLGFNIKVARTLIKYREKGGSFKHKTDLLKIYGLDSALYMNLEPYINIELNQEQHEVRIEKKKVEVLLATDKLEINSADSAAWTKLPGIGPVFAKRICNFRKYLGGFTSIEQLKEVYNFPPETYDLIKARLIVDTTNLIKVNLNFADINELKKHPYCNFELAGKIINYRAEHGSFHSVEQLLSDSVLNNSDYSRLAPYLTVK